MVTAMLCRWRTKSYSPYPLICELLAPKVFVVDKDKLINLKAVVKSETGADFYTILSAAQTCPTKTIFIVDRYTGNKYILKDCR
ncbi:MAG: hypothetical protein ACRD5B_03585 [Nitrososphaeraceae archaeon]